MATLSELNQAIGDGEMLALVRTAILVKAASIIDEPSPTQARLQFAEDALGEPQKYEVRLWRYLVGKFSGGTLDNILRSVGNAATPDDTTIQTEVDNAINKIWP